ncbi:MAG: zinc ribbon domain-containing protein [Agathobacter sp.]|nr:zinc ribbon domain-containing protein [Agathobacter sp.]
MAIGLFNIGNFSSLQNIKKELEEKNQERAKIFGYIGMEIYDLYKQGKVSISELDLYFENMENLEKEIEELEKQKNELEEQTKKTLTCSCGATLSPRDRFCGKCGKPVESKNNICECGRKIEEGLAFCPNCGKSIVGVPREITKYKECICGAKVPEGQFMCMECGRAIKK